MMKYRWRNFKQMVWRVWHRILGDLCDHCQKGLLEEVGMSGYATLRIHYECEYCGTETVFTHSPGD